METKAHQRLKRLAIGFLRQQGCLALATEVACPIARYRIDVAGYRDAWRTPTSESLIEPAGSAAIETATQPDKVRLIAPPKPGAKVQGKMGAKMGAKMGGCTIAIECKQSSEDFLRDAESVQPLLELREQLERFRLSIEEHRIKHLEPQLRQNGSSLFAELDDWDFAASRLPGYRKVLRQLRRIDEKIHGETKFFLMARYRLADQMYLAAPAGMIRPRELPSGWGLLECPPELLERSSEDDCGQTRKACDAALTPTVAAPVHDSPDIRRHRLLRNIAVAASRYV